MKHFVKKILLCKTKYEADFHMYRNEVKIDNPTHCKVCSFCRL